MFEELGTTCSREVAVSVRTPPKTRRWTGRAVLEGRSEEAGRASRGIERANTMTTPIDLYEGFWGIGGLQWNKGYQDALDAVVVPDTSGDRLRR